MSTVLAVDAFCVVSKGRGLQRLLFCCVAVQPEADTVLIDAHKYSLT